MVPEATAGKDLAPRRYAINARLGPRPRSPYLRIYAASGGKPLKEIEL